MAKEKELQEFLLKLKYMGFNPTHLQEFNITSANNLVNIIKMASSNPAFHNVEHDLATVDKLSYEQMRDLTIKFCGNLFQLNDVYVLNNMSLARQITGGPMKQPAEVTFGVINNILDKTNVTDVPVNMIRGHAMSGAIKKPLFIMPFDNPSLDRKVYFSSVSLGNQLNLLSVGNYASKIAQMQEENRIGFADDYFNSQVISIFLEKVASLNQDPSRHSLKICERIRFLDLLNRYVSLIRNGGNLSVDEYYDNLVYIKSILLATKLFDLYVNETNEKKRGSYFTDIQAVFDGKIQVEDILSRRNVNINNAQDLTLIRRHM